MSAVFALPLALALAATPDVREIVKIAIDREIHNKRQLANYTWQEATMVKIDGKPAKNKVRDHFYIDGSTYTKLVEKDGRPLPNTEAGKEQAKMDKEIAKRRSESPSQRNKRLAEERKEEAEGIQFREDVMRAFDFQMEGEELVNGFKAWRIAGTRRADFKPKSRDGKMLAKIRGQIWVHQESNEWLKFEVVTLDKVTFGAFLASVAPGARISSQQMRVNESLWHPEWMRVSLQGRALWKKLGFEMEDRYRNFRKFQTESRLVETASEPSSPQ
jgi:hypothetical protein